MSRVRRAVPVLILVGFLLALARTGESQGIPKCTCREGKACYHFLNAPVDPPDDPCHCPLCREQRGACPKRAPEGWDPVCASNDRMECFLRRHAASWDLTCSVMLDEPECACKMPHPEWCPMCGKDGHDWRHQSDLELIRRQLDKERVLFGRRAKLVIVTSPHFYVVTDIPDLKIRTEKGSNRRMGRHELAHVYAQRAEVAYEDFTRVFGTNVHTRTRIGVYLCRRRRVLLDIEKKYFGIEDLDFTYGSKETRTVGAGLCQDGTAIAQDEFTDDDRMHLRLRHNIGHMLMSRWVPAGSAGIWPNWVYRGAGHWLARLPEKFREMATFHHGEGRVESDNGSNWWKYLRRQAMDPSLTPMQRYLDMGYSEALDLDGHRRVWSWFELFLAEDRERFLKFLAGMRAGREGRAALEDAFGCSPEELEQRWRDRVLGRRESIGPTAAEIDATNPESVGARRRESIRDETEPTTLAAKIRSLEKVDDPLTAETLLPHLASDSDLVRHSTLLLLSNDPSAEVRKWLREEGLPSASPEVRARVARVLGLIPDEKAGPALLPYLDADDWETRAQVARALGRIGYTDALRKLAERVDDDSPVVQIAALDAIAGFEKRAGFAWEGVAKQLDAGAWQVRSAAAHCLGQLGELRAVDAMITRMEKEGGRVRLDLRLALKNLIGDDLGANPEYWRDWWEKEKERFGGVPPAAAMGKPSKPEDDKYALPPTFYGLRVFSQRVVYLVDASGSMLHETSIDPEWLKRNHRDYPPVAERFDLAASEVERSLRSLDPRAAFKILFFSTKADEVKKEMTPATPQNVDGAVSRLRAAKPGQYSGVQSETNYVDALRLLLGQRKDAPPSDRLRDTADTAYFLTDGFPTAGDITDVDVLRSWFRELNESARIRLHVITFGQIGTRLKFLKALAEENGGTFVLVPEVP